MKREEERGDINNVYVGEGIPYLQLDVTLVISGARQDSRAHHAKTQIQTSVHIGPTGVRWISHQWRHVVMVDARGTLTLDALVFWFDDCALLVPNPFRKVNSGRDER